MTTYSFDIGQNPRAIFQSGSAILPFGALRFQEFTDQSADPSRSSIDQKHLQLDGETGVK